MVNKNLMNLKILILLIILKWFWSDFEVKQLPIGSKILMAKIIHLDSEKYFIHFLYKIDTIFTPKKSRTS